MITPGLEFELSCLYEASSKLECKTFELYQNQVKKSTLDCLTIKIREC